MKTPVYQTLPARRSALVLAASITVLLSSHSELASTFIWDPQLNAIGSDGAGPWDNATTNWAVDGADILFPTTGQPREFARLNITQGVP